MLIAVVLPLTLHVDAVGTGCGYGYSLGEFAMESEAFARFRAAADEADIRFEASNDDFGPELTVVNVEGVKRHPD